MAPALDLAGLLELLHAEENVVLPTQHAAQVLRTSFDRQQQARGLRAWAPPPVFTWDEWTATLWRDLLLAGADDRVLLNRLQEEVLWAEIIATSAQDGALSSTALADLSKLAQSGFALAAAANALDRISGAAETYDARAFVGWCRIFRERCRAERLLPAALLEQALIRHAAALALPRQPHGGLSFVGFEQWTPARTGLLQQLEANGTAVRVISLRAAAQTATLRSAVLEGGPADELRWAVRWLRQGFEDTRGHHPRFALILPDPASERRHLESLLREILAPELEPVSADLSSTPWQFAQDDSLAHLPVIEHALWLLRWLQNPLPIEQIGTLLLSPFLSCSDLFEDRARWETQDLHQAGALGDARAATAELGATILEYQAARLATLLHEVRRFNLDRWLRTGPLSDQRD